MLILCDILETAFIFINEHYIFQDKMSDRILFTCCYLVNTTVSSCRKG